MSETRRDISIVEINKIFAGSGVVNKSFNLTVKDMNEMLEGIIYEKRLSTEEDINCFKKIIYQTTTGDFMVRNEHGTAEGFDNFPKQIKLFRIIDKHINSVNQNKLGLYWTYNSQKLRDEYFLSNIGFEGETNNWTVVSAVLDKEDIYVFRTYQMLVENWAEDEINVNDDAQPKDIDFLPYNEFIEKNVGIDCEKLV